MFYKPYIFDKTNLLIKKKLVPNIFPVKFKNNKGTDNFIIQTPTMFIPFGLEKCKFSKKEYLQVSFLNLNNYEDIVKFENFIRDIELYIKHKFKYSNYKDYTFRGSLKKNEDYPSLFKLNLLNKDILIFNEDNQKSLITDIKPKIYGKFIIQLSHIWTNNTSKLFGINFNICQIKLYVNMTHLPQTLEFIDDNDTKINLKSTNTITYKEKYNKYFDMYKKGIPINAIKQKLILDKLDPSIIDQPNKIIDTNKSTIPPPPPPPLPFGNLSTNNLSKNPLTALLGQIKSSNKSKLKKTTINQRKKTENTYKSHSLIIPNKIDIINGKNNLKKTKNNITLI
jgi:hypothetical protein